MKKDWFFSNEDSICNYRTAGVLTRNNKILVQDEYFESHKDNSNVFLEWVGIDELNNITIYPAFIKEKIKDISNNTIEHFVSIDGISGGPARQGA